MSSRRGSSHSSKPSPVVVPRAQLHVFACCDSTPKTPAPLGHFRAAPRRSANACFCWPVLINILFHRNIMAEVTIAEEVQRYGKKIRARAGSLASLVMPSSTMSASQEFEDNTIRKSLFREGTEESKSDDGWVEVDGDGSRAAPQVAQKSIPTSRLWLTRRNRRTTKRVSA